MAYGETYEEFITKFDKTAKKTTDDCYTPREIWEAVKEYVCNKYDITPDQIIRPFYPGGDYQKEDYRPDGVVVDNPPFSMVDKICAWYESHDIKYFLFCPGKRLFSNLNRTIIVTGTTIQYENGAKVNTQFVTNLEPGIVARSSPSLKRMLSSGKRAHKIIRPEFVLNFSDFEKLSAAGVEFKLKKDECVFCSSPGNYHYKIFGGTLLISDNAKKRFLQAKEQAEENEIKAGLLLNIKLTAEQEEKRKKLK